MFLNFEVVYLQIISQHHNPLTWGKGRWGGKDVLTMFKRSNKTPNEMQQSVVKFIA
jgi:hypothetical protein